MAAPLFVFQPNMFADIGRDFLSRRISSTIASNVTSARKVQSRYNVANKNWDDNWGGNVSYTQPSEIVNRPDFSATAQHDPGGGQALVTQTVFYQGYEVTVTNSGSSAYVLTGWDTNGPFSATNNKTINMITGSVIKFIINASGHPFWIKTSNSTGTGNAYNDTAYIWANVGRETGEVVFNPVTPGTYYYNCQNHSSMAGQIVVTGQATGGGGGGGGGSTLTNIKLGNTAFSAIKIGNTDISKVYVGSTQVWGAN